jgi:tRNA-dihydrouridine synthase
VFLRHIDLITKHSPDKRLVHELRKAVAWYSKGLPSSAHLREQAFSILDAKVVREIALDFFTSLAQKNISFPFKEEMHFDR